MEWGYCSGTSPVDEVGGEELDVGEWDTRRLGYLQKRLGRRGDPEVMGQRPSDRRCRGVDVCHD